VSRSAAAYFDTSVLAKRYLAEGGSAVARSLLRRRPCLSSALAPVELVSALSRRRAAGDLDDRDYSAILARVADDRARWHLVEVTGTVLDRAEDLVRHTPIRALDAVHLASALVAQMASGRRVSFVTADEGQRVAADRLGLDVTWVG